MFVDLRSLQPNPMRDFTVDPYDEEVIAKLKVSIEEDGFWGGVVCRQKNGVIQIGAGHHRVKAAIEAGIRNAEIFVGNFDDGAMVRVYARENATQRGNSGTAQTGSIASAVRFLAKQMCLGYTGNYTGINASPKSTARATSHFEDRNGIGIEIVHRFLTGVPGINEKSVGLSLANLKASGDYARIIGEVKAEIEHENEEALKALAKAEKEKADAEDRERIAKEERDAASARAKAARQEADKKRAELERQRAEAEAKLAEKRRKEAEEGLNNFEALKKTRESVNKAAETANKQPIIFDFEGVAKHLKSAQHIRVFREVVTGPGIAPYLPVNKQADLAAEIVRLSQQTDENGERLYELSGTFIKDRIVSLVLDAKRFERKVSKEEQEKLRRQSIVARADESMRQFAAAFRRMQAEGINTNKFIDEWPKGERFPVTQEFQEALKGAKKIIDQLLERI